MKELKTYKLLSVNIIPEHIKRLVEDKGREEAILILASNDFTISFIESILKKIGI